MKLKTEKQGKPVKQNLVFWKSDKIGKPQARVTRKKGRKEGRKRKEGGKGGRGEEKKQITIVIN